jgi:hypothetical protein
MVACPRPKGCRFVLQSVSPPCMSSVPSISIRSLQPVRSNQRRLAAISRRASWLPRPNTCATASTWFGMTSAVCRRLSARPCSRLQLTAPKEKPLLRSRSVAGWSRRHWTTSSRAGAARWTAAQPNAPTATRAVIFAALALGSSNGVVTPIDPCIGSHETPSALVDHSAGITHPLNDRISQSAPVFIGQSLGVLSRDELNALNPP